MEIRNRETGEVITFSELKRQNPSTSFPAVVTDEILDGYGYDPVLTGAQASVTGPYETSVRQGVVQVNGQWFTKYVVGPIFTDIEGGQTADEQQTAYRASVDARVAEAVRTERNKKLGDTDWTQLADSTADATDWATYRQQLRDLPATSGDNWPHNVTWPTEPS